MHEIVKKKSRNLYSIYGDYELNYFPIFLMFYKKNIHFYIFNLQLYAVAMRALSGYVCKSLLISSVFVFFLFLHFYLMVLMLHIFFFIIHGFVIQNDFKYFMLYICIALCLSINSTYKMTINERYQ